MYRMTNRELSSNTSEFNQTMFKPLNLLNQKSTFSGLSEGLKNKVFENVFKTTLDSLKAVISEIMTEERRVNESLKKFKK